MSRYQKSIHCCWVCLCLAAGARADTFGTGTNQFTIDFVTIPGNPGTTRNINTSGAPIETFTAGVVGDYTDPGNDYRIGVYEITNDQWNKFLAECAVPLTGSPSSAYDEDAFWTSTNVPVNNDSWYEAAQFVNWLNTSTGHHAAYRFTGTQGQDDYTLDTWDVSEADNETNLYRHKDAAYYLPTEDEWLKAAYWNGSDLQTWTTPDDTKPVAGVEANYDNVIGQPWDVGGGCEELNGTFDMAGNVWEWMESPDIDGTYQTASWRGMRGATYGCPQHGLPSCYRGNNGPSDESFCLGFRIAAEVPEPGTLGLLLLGGLTLLNRRP